jgi:hypothetical protein
MILQIKLDITGLAVFLVRLNVCILLQRLTYMFEVIYLVVLDLPEQKIGLFGELGSFKNQMPAASANLTP